MAIHQHATFFMAIGSRVTYFHIQIMTGIQQTIRKSLCFLRAGVPNNISNRNTAKSVTIDRMVPPKRKELVTHTRRDCLPGVAFVSFLGDSTEFELTTLLAVRAAGAADPRGAVVAHAAPVFGKVQFLAELGAAARGDTADGADATAVHQEACWDTIHLAHDVSGFAEDAAGAA